MAPTATTASDVIEAERERQLETEPQPAALAAGAVRGAHRPGCRKVYPTPRTVWIKRGASFASVLRRKYPM